MERREIFVFGIAVFSFCLTINAMGPFGPKGYRRSIHVCALPTTVAISLLPTSVFVHLLSSHHGSHRRVRPVVDDQILKYQEQMVDRVCTQLMIGGADGGRECHLRAAFIFRQLVEGGSKDETGTLPG